MSAQSTTPDMDAKETELLATLSKKFIHEASKAFSLGKVNYKVVESWFNQNRHVIAAALELDVDELGFDGQGSTQDQKQLMHAYALTYTTMLKINSVSKCVDEL